MLRIIIVLVSLAPFSLPGWAEGQSRKSYLHFERSVIVDYGIQHQPVAALTLFVPQGWQAQGGIVWGNEFMCTNGYAIRWQVLAPDNLSGALIFPQRGWEYNSNNGPVVNINCAKAQIYNVEAYLRLLLQDIRPDARDVKFRPRDDLLAEFPNTREQKNWAMGVQQFWVETGELVFYFEEQGVVLEGHLAAALTFENTITDTAAYQAEAVQVRALPAYGTFAPEAEYNSAMFRAIRKSLVPDPQWAQQIQVHNAKMNNITLQGISDRARIAADTNRDISNIIHDSWQRQQAGSDRRAREFLEVIRETETYNDASAPGGQIGFSSQYDQAWKLEDDTYILTNELGFDPVKALGVGGTQLQVAE